MKACEENGLMGPYGPLCFRYERKKKCQYIFFILVSCAASSFNFKENWVVGDCWYEQWAPQA